jgi:hypothetical protein
MGPYSQRACTAKDIAMPKATWSSSSESVYTDLVDRPLLNIELLRPHLVDPTRNPHHVLQRDVTDLRGVTRMA